MSDEQIEHAARELCRLRGIDPDSLVAHGHDPKPGETRIPLSLLYSPAWTRAAREVRLHATMNQAIEFGMSNAE